MKHPVHPIIVHFPLVGWTVTFFLDLYQYIYASNNMNIINVVVTVSCVFAVIAMAAGMFDLIRQTTSKKIMRKFEKHMYWALSTFIVFTIRALMPHFSLHELYNISALMTSTLGFFMLIYTAKLGGDLVYIHGMGTRDNKSNN